MLEILKDPTIWVTIVVLLLLFVSVYGIMQLIRFLIKKLKQKKTEKPEIRPIIEKKYIVDKQIIPEHKLNKLEFYQKANPRDYLKNLPFLKRIALKLKTRKNPEKLVLVRMKMNNDTVIEKLMLENEQGFEFEDQHYIFDTKNKYETISDGKKMMAYDFQETISLPYKLKKELPNEVKEYIGRFNSSLTKGEKAELPTDEIKTLLENDNVSNVSSAINPTNLNRYLKSNLIQQLVMALTSSKILKIMFILVIIVLILNGIDLIIDAVDSGLFGDFLKK